MELNKSAEEIGRIQKNRTTFTLVQLMEYKGNRYMDIREFFTSASGDFVATKKGVAIPIDKISELVTLVERAEAKTHELSGL